MRALRIYETTAGPSTLPVADVHLQLGNLYGAQNKQEKAAKEYKRTYEIRLKLLGPDHFHTAISMSNLAYSYTKLKRYKEAEPLFQEAVATIDKSFGPNPDNLNVADIFGCYARLLLIEGKPNEADDFYKRAAAIKDRQQQGREAFGKSP